MPQRLQFWDLWYPQAGATGVAFARGRLEASRILLVHAPPPMLTVEVRSDRGMRLAFSENFDSDSRSAHHAVDPPWQEGYAARHLADNQRHRPVGDLAGRRSGAFIAMVECRRWQRMALAGGILQSPLGARGGQLNARIMQALHRGVCRGLHQSRRQPCIQFA